MDFYITGPINNNIVYVEKINHHINLQCPHKKKNWGLLW